MTTSQAVSELVAAVERPIGQATGLPNPVYTSTEFFRLERDRIFAPSWACLGHACDVAQPGDLHPMQLLGVPLLVTRTASGAVRVFHNVCSHRGNQLVWEPCRTRGAIRCPYHAWTYDLEGRLTGTPNIGGPGRHEADGFERGAHGLEPVRSAVWLDLVFVNLSGDAEPFAEFIAPLAQRFERLGGPEYERRLRPAATHGELRFDVRANWKLALENNLDASHLPWVHPSLNRQSPLEDHYCFMDQAGFAGQGSSAYDTVPHESPALPRIEAWPDRIGEYPCLYPNVFVSGHADHFWSMVLEPVAPDRTVERWRGYFVDEAADGAEFEPARATIREGWMSILGEDVAVVEGMQRGRGSPAFHGGIFTPVLDPPLHHFHRWVANRLAAPERGRSPAAAVRGTLQSARPPGRSRHGDRRRTPPGLAG